MLKSLEIYGFKSFADRTRFEFSPGLTGVVGPNGSGKSNVVDALKWILGDQSPKSLRGSEMTDVIFNGSASRKPCSFAEAFLTIDNSKKFLNVDATEVAIGRRIYRGGDAEYLINKAPARLKDVRDLLLGSGAGNAAYCIIEQGRVDQILQANPTSRRIVFEEAAGISRFKARRVEAQRKLERVAQNLQRLKDIVDEVEARLNATRGHAAKAVKYRELSADLRRWWLGLAADDYRAITGELKTLQEHFALTEFKLNELATVQQELDAAEARFDAELAEIEQHLKEAERRNSQNREAIATQEASLQFQTSRLQEQATEQLRLQDQQIDLGRRVREAESEVALATQRIQAAGAEELELRTRLNSQDVQLQSVAAAVEAARNDAEQKRAIHWELTRSAAAAEQAVAAWDAQQEALEQARGRLHGQREEILQEQQRVEAEHDRLRRDYETLRQALEAAQNEHRVCLESFQQSSAALQIVQQNLADAREARSAASARRAVLEDLELRQEGLGIGVRELLHRARYSTAPPWNSIVGSVADLLEVDLESAGLIEVALGARAQFIVLREFQPLLDYLAQDGVQLTGRVGFLAVPDRTASEPLPPQRDRARLVHLQSVDGTGPQLNGRPGVIRRADDLILSERGITGLAAAVLGDTWIVRDLATALQLAAEIGRGVRFVTLQGELLDDDCALHLGMIRSETSLLSRKSELRRIKNDLTRLERDVSLKEAEHAEQQRAVAAADAALGSVAKSVTSLEEQLRESLLVWHAADQEADRTRHESERLAGQLQAAEQELQRVVRQQTEASARWTELSHQLEAAAEDLARAEVALAEARQSAQALEQRKTAEQLDLVQQAERVRNEQAMLERWKHELHQRGAQLEEGARRIAVSTESRQRNALQLLNARAVLADHYHAVDALDAEAHRWQAAKHQLRQQRGAHVERELQIRQERRKLQDQRHADEIRTRELNHQMTALDERIQEEYQLSLKDVCGEGHSAWGLYLDQGLEAVSDKGREPRAESQEPESVDAAALDSRLSTLDSPRPAPEFAVIRPEIEAHVGRLRRKLKLLGHVNTESLQDLEQLEQRFTQLSSQLQDLVEANAALEDIIRRINHESRRLFAETFNTIRGNFRNLFRKVFGGGEGDVVLEDPDDILECGIEITARPPGKELRGLSLLSGGEKTMTAIALIMAIFQAKPSPFCILDEVDAALDEANVDRFAAVLREFQTTTQFIMITHHKRSMMAADVLYGVTMEESGISKRMSVRFEDIAENGEFRRAA